MITSEQIQEITNVIVETVHPAKVYLFGSYANGSQTKDSDIDFLVTMPDRNKKKTGLAKELYDKTRHLAEVPKDIIIDYAEKYERFHNILYSFIGHIVKTGNLLYEG